MIGKILLVSVFAAGMYVVLLPVPEDIEIPWKLKAVTLIGFKLMPCLAPFVPSRLSNYLGEAFGSDARSRGPNVTYTDTTMDGVVVRVLGDEQTEEDASKRPAIVFYHGGGFNLGNVDQYHSMMAEFSRHLDAVIVSVEYRLAPEHIFPAAIDDCTRATVAFLQRTADFNVDPTRVAIMGDSAGGNLAAAVAQRFTFDPKYKELPKLKMQVLIYPCLQAFDFQLPSYQQNGDYSTIVLDTVAVAECLARYLNNKPALKTAISKNQHTTSAAKKSPMISKVLSHDLIPPEFKRRGYIAPLVVEGDQGLYEELREGLLNPDFAPLMREDLKGLPEAYILTAEYDVLRDDGIIYTKRLEEAGVKVTWKNYKKGFHGMFSPRHGPFACPSGDLAINDFLEFMSKNL